MVTRDAPPVNSDLTSANSDLASANADLTSANNDRPPANSNRPPANSDLTKNQMPRLPRQLHPGHCYHITTRCNNREFRLTRFECRELLLFAIKQCQEKFEFKLYALCIMSNHVHYLMEPKEPADLPRIMHWLNWYSAMCFNRMLNRTGHFWEKRYHSTGFPNTDKRRVLNTLRYIHASPKAIWGTLIPKQHIIAPLFQGYRVHTSYLVPSPRCRSPLNPP